MTRRLIPLALLVVFAATTAAQPAPKAAKDARFRVALESKLTMNGDGQEIKLDASASFDYTWKRNDKTRTLIVDALTVKVVADGKEMLDAKMSRAGIFTSTAGKKTNLKFEDAPEQVKKMLTDLFDSPICAIEVDAVGKEVKRKVLAGPGAIGVLDSGLIANCTMFHPWYESDKDEWRADVEVSAGEAVVKGPLAYKKTAGGKGGQQIVKVSGTLAADGVKDRKGNTIKDGKYTITGQQTYDPTRQEWIAGQWSMDIAFAMTRNDKELARAKGTMAVTFEMLPEKK